MVDRVLTKPITGGVFGRGRYALASMPCVSRGLHSIQYMVVEPKAGSVISLAENKVEALAGARRIISASVEIEQQEQAWQQLALDMPPPHPDMSVAALIPAAGTTATIPRRRREIFEKTGGRCHYCGEVLTLDGKWHVEHMQPRALGGGDDLLNLVAACVPCNLSKADRTALEFVAKSRGW